MTDKVSGPDGSALSEGLGLHALHPLKCCPFCGKAHTLKLTTAQQLAEEGDDEPEPWLHSESWAVNGYCHHETHDR